MDIIMGVLRIFPFCLQLSRSGDWKKYRAARREAGAQGAFRKGMRKYQNARSQGEIFYVRSEEGTDFRTPDSDAVPMSGGHRYQRMYQPPEASPPNEARSYLLADMGTGRRPRSASQGYLMADAAPPGRPRASSQSALMAEAHVREDFPRPYGTGTVQEQRYDRSRSISPARFVEPPKDGREMV